LKLFFNIIVVKFLCTVMNKRAAKYFGLFPERNFVVFGLKWKDVLPEEMYVFFALIFVMGIVNVVYLVLWCYSYSTSVYCI